jgi:cation diffusion facilitator family transporter
MNYYRKVGKVLKIIFIANIIVALTKIIVGSMMNYSSLLADGYHAITDSTSNIIALIGIKISSKPPDKHHPYGHYKFETIAGFFIMLLIGL